MLIKDAPAQARAALFVVAAQMAFCRAWAGQRQCSTMRALHWWQRPRCGLWAAAAQRDDVGRRGLPVSIRYAVGRGAIRPTVGVSRLVKPPDLAGGKVGYGWDQA